MIRLRKAWHRAMLEKWKERERSFVAMSPKDGWRIGLQTQTPCHALLSLLEGSRLGP